VHRLLACTEGKDCHTTRCSLGRHFPSNSDSTFTTYCACAVVPFDEVQGLFPSKVGRLQHVTANNVQSSAGIASEQCEELTYSGAVKCVPACVLVVSLSEL
jgi:hypothetical protein